MIDENRQNHRLINRPLAELVRPHSLEKMVGKSIEAPWLKRLFQTQRVVSLLIHGPPGVGKTTLARCLFERSGYPWNELSAVSSSLKELKPTLMKNRSHYLSSDEPTGLFIDEIHRFNKAQQDALLPYLEEGSTILIGATTENPSFSINRALRSRLRILKIDKLSVDAICDLLQTVWKSDSRHRLWPNAEINSDAMHWIARAAQGDARRAIGLLEQALQDGSPLTVEMLRSFQPSPILNYDKKGDAHYEYASALIKSMRTGDEKNAAYWLLRFIDGGGDPRFVLRRLAIFASEDVGNAQPDALSVVNSAASLFDRVGRPEGDHHLMQTVIYLSRCHKSREVVDALLETRSRLRQEPDRSVPRHLLPEIK